MAVPSGATNRYLASDLTATHDPDDPVETWDDAAGSDDLTSQDATDDPTYQENFGTLNLPCVEFGNFRTNDSDDWMQTAAFSEAISQPFSLVFIGEIDAVDSSFDYLLTSRTTGDDATFGFANFGWGSNAPSSLTASEAPSADTPYVAVAAFDGDDSYIWVNDSEIGSGDTGSNGLDGLTVAAFGDGTAQCAARYAEILVYDRALTSQDLDDLYTYYQQTYILSSPEATISHGPSYSHKARVKVTEEQFTFTPPTTDGAAWGDPNKLDAANRLMRFYGSVRTGKTVYRDSAGVFHEEQSPYNRDLLDATHVYLGGHAHVIGRTEKDLLEAAGYEDNIE